MGIVILLVLVAPVGLVLWSWRWLFTTPDDRVAELGAEMMPAPEDDSDW